MAASKKNAKGSKTAHVLNLLTAPGAPKEGPSAAGEPTAEGAETAAAPSRPLLPPILEVAQANDDNLSQQIQQALEEELADSAEPAPPPQPILEEVPPMAVEQPVAEQTSQTPAPSGGKMSQEDIEKMLAAANAPAQEPAPEPAPAAPSGGKMSQEDIEKMLAAANAPAQEPAPAPEPAPAAPSGGKMSQEDIEKMLAAASAPAQEPAPAPEPAPAAPSGGKMSQEDIEKMLAAANAPAQEPAPEPAPAVPSGGKMSQEDIEKMLAAANAPAQEPAPAPEPAPVASKPTPPPPAPAEDEDVSYINIMQVLVEEKAPAYIKKFGLCTCKQCEADVKALTLTNLVPKYVVLSKLDRIPMLTVYEGRFNSTVFAQLTRACKVVMDHPHHHR